MAFVITSPCEAEKAGECVTVCPVDCIEKGPDQYLSIQIYVLIVGLVYLYVR